MWTTRALREAWVAVGQDTTTEAASVSAVVEVWSWYLLVKPKPLATVPDESWLVVSMASVAVAVVALVRVNVCARGMLDVSVVATDPAEVVTSPVKAGIWLAATEPERLVKEGCALLMTPAAEMAVRKLLEAPVSATTVVPMVPLAFLSWKRRSVESL